MCGIAGFLSLDGATIGRHKRFLEVLGDLISHRGPDGYGTWINDKATVGLVHRRLAIIDLSDQAAQPMTGHGNSTISYNGEIYNYKELRENAEERGISSFSNSDTETILSTYAQFGVQTPKHLRGMFAYALWDDDRQRLTLARDRFGIKPLYYAIVDNLFVFASEAKALLPFLPSIKTDSDALAEYLTFQYSISNKTLFEGVHQVMPGHTVVIENGVMTIEKYWDVQYEVDYSWTPDSAEEKLREILAESIDVHLRSDVEVGSYLSGGIDSSLMAIMASGQTGSPLKVFHGCFREHPGYDESSYAEIASKSFGGDLFVTDITAEDFCENIRKVIYHLDFPVAGPGSFPQFMVSKLASEHLKVVLGGQGGDEIFGGYARYLVAYFEQCIKAAIDGTYKDGNYVVTIESIIPNLGILREYTPLIQEFWKDGLFGPLDQRFLRLIDRSTDMQQEISWGDLDIQGVYHRFYEIFNSRANVAKEAYFDSMTHFEIKTLLPALLQVEDRMSMAHGLESRVPLLDHPLIEFAATVPADIKFEGGQLKHLLKTAFAKELPPEILNRRDKMGFPVPLKEWFASELNDFVLEIFADMKTKNREFVNTDAVVKNFGQTGQFSRKTWALLSLELWQQEFHDKASEYRALLK
jgi:asparagine synthase (glutamine-hydrolysing)